MKLYLVLMVPHFREIHHLRRKQKPVVKKSAYNPTVKKQSFSRDPSARRMITSSFFLTFVINAVHRGNTKRESKHK